MSEAPKYIVPKRLSPIARAWVQGVIEDYRLQEHHFRILIQAADFYDEAEEATKALRLDGVLIRLSALRGAPVSASQLWLSKLGLDADDTPGTRIPGSRSHHGKGYYA